MTKNQIRQQMRVARAELIALARMLGAYPEKEKEAYGAAHILSDWIKGIDED